MSPDLRLPRRVIDPTHTITLKRTYQKQLRALFKNFKKKITPIIGTALQKYITFSAIDDISDDMDMLIEYEIHGKSHRIIKQNLTLSYLAGKRSAANNPRVRRARLTIPIEMSFIDEEILHDLQVRNFNLVKGATSTMKASMLRVMDEGIRQHKGVRPIARDMRAQVDGIIGKRADVIVQTEISHSYNTAVSQSYEKAGIKKWQWLATMGERCCEICASKHGEIFNWGDARPPEHPRCYCTVYPIVEKPFKR